MVNRYCDDTLNILRQNLILVPQGKAQAEAAHPILAVGDDGERCTEVSPCRGMKQCVEVF